MAPPSPVPRPSWDSFPMSGLSLKTKPHSFISPLRWASIIHWESGQWIISVSTRLIVSKVDYGSVNLVCTTVCVIPQKNLFKNKSWKMKIFFTWINSRVSFCFFKNKNFLVAQHYLKKRNLLVWYGVILIYESNMLNTFPLFFLSPH